jgi:hypothetical protein
MAYSNADKQQRYRQRLRARGLVHVQGWVTPAQAEAIRRIMAERGWEVPRAAGWCGVAPRVEQRAERNHP